MKNNVELGVRADGVQLLELTEEEKICYSTRILMKYISIGFKRKIMISLWSVNT